MKPLTFAVQLTGAKRNKDDSVVISFTTESEIDTAVYAGIDEQRKRNGWLVFQANGEVLDKDIPKEDAKISGQISPSQYLRNCLFAKHMKLGGKKEDFPGYYERAIYGFAQAVNDSYGG